MSEKDKEIERLREALIRAARVMGWNYTTEQDGGKWVNGYLIIPPRGFNYETGKWTPHMSEEK